MCAILLAFFSSSPKRSMRTSQQYDKLRSLLMENGIQPKANKSSVLTEVARYMQQLEDKVEEQEKERQRREECRAR